MKSGCYRISFNVDLTDCDNEEEAHVAISEMVQNILDEGTFPQLEFELVEEFFPEYNVEENEVEELNF